MTVETFAAAPADVDRPASGMRWRTMVTAALLVLLGGAALGGWAVWRYATPAAVVAPNPDAVVRAAPLPANAVARPAVAAAPAPAPLSSSTLTAPESFATRLALLEDRLARITVAADGALGNAGKAEALVIALAARRAIDRGAPLGPLEAPLRARFSDTQPQAVEAIITAARAPVSDRQLIDQFEELRRTLEQTPNANLIERVRAGIDSLIIIRRSDQPSPAPQDRYARAHAALERGRYDLAIAETERMPGATAPNAAAWLNSLRRRNDAARALDLIETAALVSPAPPAVPVAPR